MNHKLTTKRVSTIRRVGWLSVASMLALALLAPGANAGHGVTIVTSLTDPNLAGNPACSKQGNDPAGLEDWYGGGQDWVEYKIDATAFVDDHVYDVDGDAGSKTITLDLVDADTINWSSNFGIDAVFVKAGNAGGDGYNTLYVYAPTAGHAEAMAGSLVNGSHTGISHLSFCYDVNDPTTSTTTTGSTTTTTTGSTTTTTTTGSTTTSSTTTSSTTTASTTTGSTTTASTTTVSTTTAATTPSQAVLSETGTPSVTLPPTDALSGSSTPSSDSWRLFLVAMAALLASVLVMTPAKAASRRR